MALPDVSAEKFHEAMRRFDEEFRSHPEFADWENNLAHKYAIELGGKRYPVKKILSLATGTPVNGFSGGKEANEYVSRRGLQVVELRQNEIKNCLETILSEYVPARKSQPMSSQAHVARMFDRCQQLLTSHQLLDHFPEIKVKASYGKGNWAKVPWIALLDSRETDTTQKGVYPVILFRQDCSGLYVTFNQGVTEPQSRLGGTAGLEEVRAKARRIRSSEVGRKLSASGFLLDDGIDLVADPGLGRDYEASTIAYKYYAKGEVPADSEILRDLDAVLTSYAKYLESQTVAITLVREPSLCLLGTAKGPSEWLPQAQAVIAREGAWATWWSFPIRPEARQRLVSPFELYINTGGGTFPLKFIIAEYATSQGSTGIVSPWPNITDPSETGKTRAGDAQSQTFKTWFKVSAIEALDPPLRLTDFKPAAGLSTVSSLLNQSAFGYAQLAAHEVKTAGDETTLDSLLEQTLLDREVVEEIVAALGGAQRQIVLAGPPGTSKTFIAERIARYICQGFPDRYRMVQFHPSYSYESFIEGLRPVVREGGGISFEREDGVVLDLVRKMTERGHVGTNAPTYLLLIDEMNRANLPRVFGELMYLFEYRDNPMRLQHSAEFSLPPNLGFIGTMNTADRSIRSIDSALRRRFDVFEFQPDATILDRFFSRVPLAVPNLIAGFTALNEALEHELDRHHTIGHAFFMRPGLDRHGLRAIWTRKIYPLIEEYFFDQMDLARKFTIDRFWPEGDG